MHEHIWATQQIGARLQRQPREDFITEALADLLNRLSSIAQIEFCAEFLHSTATSPT